MPTKIDELVISLALDPSGLTKGQRELLASYAKTQEKIKEESDKIGRSTKNTADNFNKIRDSVLGLGAAYFGLSAVKDFVTTTTQLDSALGRVAARIGQGVSPAILSTWGMAVRRVTQDAGAAAEAFEYWSRTMAAYRTGQTSGEFNRQYGVLRSINPRLNQDLPIDQQFIEMSRAAQTYAKQTNVANAMSILTGMGLSTNFAQYLLQGPKAIKSELAAKDTLKVTDEDVARADQLRKDWDDLTDNMGRAGRDWLNYFFKGDNSFHKLIEWLNHADAATKDWTVAIIALVSVMATLGGLRGLLAMLGLGGGGGGKGITTRLFSWLFGSILGKSLFGAAGGFLGLFLGSSRPLGGNEAEDLKRYRSLYGNGGGTPADSLGDMPFHGGLRRGHGASAAYGSVGAWWTPERQAHAIDYLMQNAGLSREGAAGLVARWASIEARGGPSSVTPISGAFGVGQWLGARKKGIAGNTDFDAQLAHAASELNTTEWRAARALRAAKTAQEAARGASMYERAEGYNAATGYDYFTTRTPVQQVLDRYHKPLDLGTITPKRLKQSWWDQWRDHPAMGSLGIQGAAASAAVDRSSPTNNQSNIETNIGRIDVHTQATDAQGIASDIAPALRNKVMTSMNYGLA